MDTVDQLIGLTTAYKFENIADHVRIYSGHRCVNSLIPIGVFVRSQ